MSRLLITGAGGDVGSCLASWLSREHTGRFELVLFEQQGKRTEALAGVGHVVIGDAADPKALSGAMKGVDTVVHLAANRSARASWDELRGPNVEAVYQVFATAKEAGCRHVVYASSVNAALSYESGERHEHAEPRAKNLYGVAKGWGELLGRYYGEQTGLPCTAVRIGAYQTADEIASPKFARLRGCWVSPGDLNRLILACIDRPPERYRVVNAVSLLDEPCMPTQQTQAETGWSPQDKLPPLKT